ncbi:hypothetical protein [Echinicola rosea]|nr:hypothetical protein [Echinicola rosea]
MKNTFDLLVFSYSTEQLSNDTGYRYREEQNENTFPKKHHGDAKTVF